VRLPWEPKEGGPHQARGPGDQDLQ
jgi:hypothetical protein